MTRISRRLPKDRTGRLYLGFAVMLLAAGMFAASQGAFPAEAAGTTASTTVHCTKTEQQKILVVISHYACPMGAHATSATISWNTSGLSLINLRLACKPSYNRDVFAGKGSGSSTYVVNKTTHPDLYAVMSVSPSCTFYLTITARKAVTPTVKKSSP